MPISQETHRQGQRRRRQSSAGFAAGPWILDHVLLLALVAVLMLALLAEMPWLSRGVRSHLLQADVVLLFTGIAAAGTAEGRLRMAALRGPNGWLAALLAWCCFSAVLAPYRDFAVAELLRLALGAGVYFAAAYVLRPQEQRLLSLFLIGLGAAVGLYGLIQFGQTLNLAVSETNSIFGNHEQLGSFLTLLFPPALALALDRTRPPKQLLFAQGAALILGAALLLARTRSAWVGAVVSLLLLSFLSLRYSPVRLNKTNRALIIGPALLVLIAFVGLLAFGEIAPLVSTRAATLSHALDDTSFSDRLHRWRSACRMASERPLTGWGLGSWPVQEGRWTHQGDDAAEVLGSGTGHSNLAHNFWVQWTAETGGVGLALYVAFLASFFVAAGRALPRLDPASRTLLIACLVGAASGLADMIGAPSYTFPGVSSLFLVWLGLGLGLVREGDLSRNKNLPQPLLQRGARLEGAEAGPPPTERVPLLPPSGGGVGGGLLPPILGCLAALLVIGIGDKLRTDGATAQRGTLTVTADPPGPVAPGTHVQWTATYHALDGTLRPTAPGVIWTTTAGRLDSPGPLFISDGKAPMRSGWSGTVPADVGTVTVTASYLDNFSREIQASCPISVNSVKNHTANLYKIDAIS